MKTTVVVESFSSFKTNVLFQRIPTFFKFIAICFVADVITTLYYLLLAFNSKVADVIAIGCG